MINMCLWLVYIYYINYKTSKRKSPQMHMVCKRGPDLESISSVYTYTGDPAVQEAKPFISESEHVCVCVDTVSRRFRECPQKKMKSLSRQQLPVGVTASGDTAALLQHSERGSACRRRRKKERSPELRRFSILERRDCSLTAGSFRSK